MTPTRATLVPTLPVEVAIWSLGAFRLKGVAELIKVGAGGRAEGRGGRGGGQAGGRGGRLGGREGRAAGGRAEAPEPSVRSLV